MKKLKAILIAIGSIIGTVITALISIFILGGTWKNKLEKERQKAEEKKEEIDKKAEEEKKEIDAQDNKKVIEEITGVTEEQIKNKLKKDAMDFASKYKRKKS